MAVGQGSLVGPSAAVRPSCRSLNDERRASRSLIAAIVAGGLALSASLYPKPDELPIVDRLNVPGIDGVLDISEHIESILMKHVAEFDGVSVGELLKAAEVLEGQPNVVPVKMLLALTETFGIRHVLEGLERIAVTADILRTQTIVFGGGGGGADGSPLMVLPKSLSEWVLLLDMLLHRTPEQLLDRLSYAITRLLPQLADPVVLQRLTSTVAAAPTIQAFTVEGVVTSPPSIAPPPPPPPPSPPLTQVTEAVTINTTSEASPTTVEAPSTNVQEAAPLSFAPNAVSVIDEAPGPEGSAPVSDSGDLGEPDGDGDDSSTHESGSAPPSSEENGPDTTSSNSAVVGGESDAPSEPGETSPSGTGDDAPNGESAVG